MPARHLPNPAQNPPSPIHLRINAGHPVALTVLRNRKVLTLAITVDARITQSELVIPEQLRKLRESLDRYPFEA